MKRISITWCFLLFFLKLLAQQPIITLKAHQGPVNTLFFLSDDKSLISASRDYSIKVWDIKSLEAISIFRDESDVKAIAVSPDNKILASGNSKSEIKIWSLESGQQIKELLYHEGHIFNLSFRDDGKYLFSAGYDQKICTYDLEQSKLIQEFSLPEWMRGAKFDSKGKVFVNVPYYEYMYLWDIEQQKSIQEFKTWRGRKEPQTKAGRLLNYPSGLLYKVFPPEERFLEDVALSPNSQALLTCSYDGKIKLWQQNKKRSIRTYKGHSSSADKIVFSKSGKYFVSISNGYYTQNVLLFDIKNRKPILKLDYPEVYSVAFSNSDEYIACGGHDNMIKIWDISSALKK